MHSRLTAPELAPEQAWFKSSYSDAGQNCVEAALLLPPTAGTPFVAHLRQTTF